MSPVTKRFLQVIDYLVLMKKVDSVRDFAHQIGTGSATVTELKQGRNDEVSTKFIAITVKKFNINAGWLITGHGSITNKDGNDEVNKLLEKIKSLRSENSLLRQITGNNSKPISTISHSKPKRKQNQRVTK